MGETNADAGKAECQSLSTDIDSPLKRRAWVAHGPKGAMKMAAEPISEEREVRLSRSDIEALLESLSYSRLKVDSQDSPYEVRRAKLAELDRIAARLRAAR
jgi:hypothetical protein